MPIRGSVPGSVLISTFIVLANIKVDRKYLATSSPFWPLTTWPKGIFSVAAAEVSGKLLRTPDPYKWTSKLFSVPPCPVSAQSSGATWPLSGSAQSSSEIPDSDVQTRPLSLPPAPRNYLLLRHQQHHPNQGPPLQGTLHPHLCGDLGDHHPGSCQEYRQVDHRVHHHCQYQLIKQVLTSILPMGLVEDLSSDP